MDRLEDILIFACDSLTSVLSGTSRLDRLHRLEIHHCTEALESELEAACSLSALTELAIHGRGKTRGTAECTVLPRTTGLDRLKHLLVAECPHVTDMMCAVESARALEVVKVDGVGLSSLLASAMDLRSLQELTIADSAFFTSILNSQSSLSNLQQLLLDSPDTLASILPNFCPANSLQQLHLYNSEEGEYDSSCPLMLGGLNELSLFGRSRDEYYSTSVTHSIACLPKRTLLKSDSLVRKQTALKASCTTADCRQCFSRPPAWSDCTSSSSAPSTTCMSSQRRSASSAICSTWAYSSVAASHSCAT